MSHKALLNAIKDIVGSQPFDTQVVQAYLARLEEGKLTRDENPQTHFCVYFAAYSPDSREVFIGHHKKSGLWLFNGGHIDKNELPSEAVSREIWEEWGLRIEPNAVGEPKLLTITKILPSTNQTCTRHYDMWYFFPIDKTKSAFDREKLEIEFYQNQWLTVNQARNLMTDPNSLLGVEVIEKLFEQN